MFLSQRDRERISACEDERWCDGNYERYLPEGSPWFGKGLNNTYTTPWYQLDFTMKMKFYGPTNDNANIIREVNIDFEKLGSNNDTDRFEEMDFTIGNTDTEDNFTVTTTIDETPAQD